MKNAVFLFLIAATCGCGKKNQQVTPSIISLPNTTWRGFITTETLYNGSTDSLFQFAKFNGSTQVTVGVGNSLTDPNGSFDTVPCVIKADPKNAGSQLFIVSYASGKIDTGFTLETTNHIVFNGYALSKLK